MAIVKDLTVEKFFKDLETHGWKGHSISNEDPVGYIFSKKAKGVALPYYVEIVWSGDFSENKDGSYDLLNTDEVSIGVVKIVKGKVEDIQEEVSDFITATNAVDFYQQLAQAMQKGFDLIRSVTKTEKPSDSKSSTRHASARQKSYIHGMVKAIRQFGVLDQDLTTDQIQNLNYEEADKIIKAIKPAYETIYEQYKNSLRKK